MIWFNSSELVQFMIYSLTKGSFLVEMENYYLCIMYYEACRIYETSTYQKRGDSQMKYEYIYIYMKDLRAKGKGKAVFGCERLAQQIRRNIYEILSKLKQVHSLSQIVCS